MCYTAKLATDGALLTLTFRVTESQPTVQTPAFFQLESHLRARAIHFRLASREQSSFERLCASRRLLYSSVSREKEREKKNNLLALMCKRTL